MESDIVLQTEGLTKRYGTLVAVNDLTLHVHQGEVFGFLGPNGAGKTTAISMMCGLLQPDAGRVMVCGLAVHDSTAAARARIGVCPQNIVLWERLTCIEQLQFMGEMYGMGGRDARRRGEQLLDDLGLADKRNKLARTLSGGMQRRLNLAMALVHDPDIVVLDEPEAGLDPQSRVKVREYVRSLARRKTIILTTHNMDEADRLADRVAVIDHGELLVVDTPAALKRRLGEGDVLEIGFASEPGDTSGSAGIERALAALAQARLCAQAEVRAADHTLTVRAHDIIALLPALLEAIAASGVRYSDVRLRENTLEDVFITLTGRRLRE